MAKKGSTMAEQRPVVAPVILSGGAGTRLWPLSRELSPKQFLRNLVGERSLFQLTVLRLGGLPEARPPMIVCNEQHRFMVRDQLSELNVAADAVLLEPVGKNTAPAAAVAAFHAREGGADPLLLVVPADHLIMDDEAFRQAVGRGVPWAMQGKLVVFGIVPTAPETGFGYIHKGESLDGPAVSVVGRFVEKPDLDTARRFVESGDHLWNSGMFLFRASVFLDELKRHAPEIFQHGFDAHARARRFDGAHHLDAEAFAAGPGDSIDYAVMEKTAQAVVVDLEAGWSDVGAWSSLWGVGEKNGDGNVVRGDVLTHDTRGSFLSATERMVATVGVENLVVVATRDAVLVAAKDRVQDVKEIVGRLKAHDRPEISAHCRVYRPWGDYESIDAGDRFQVKRITVNPGAALSLQLHHHRAEHWIVVRGTARITRGEETFVLSENESTYIPLGMRHRLENPGRIPLELIEVQSGSYLGEDDIVRFDDRYGREA